MKITLIRHGLTDPLEQHLYYGATDVPLNAKGIAELEKLREEIAYPQGVHFYTSGMLRAEQTFEVIYGRVAHDIIPEIREMNFGIFEMKSYEMLKDDPAFQQWISGDYVANVAPGGESYLNLRRRCSAEADKLVLKGEDAAVVCHGGSIATIMHHYFGGDNPYTYIPGPGRGYTIEFEAGKAVSFDEL